MYRRRRRRTLQRHLSRPSLRRRKHPLRLCPLNRRLRLLSRRRAPRRRHRSHWYQPSRRFRRIRSLHSHHHLQRLLRRRPAPHLPLRSTLLRRKEHRQPNTPLRRAPCVPSNAAYLTGNSGTEPQRMLHRDRASAVDRLGTHIHRVVYRPRSRSSIAVSVRCVKDLLVPRKPDLEAPVAQAGQRDRHRMSTLPVHLAKDVRTMGSVPALRSLRCLDRRTV